MNILNLERPAYSTHDAFLPCCDSRVRLRYPVEDGIQLYPRTCKNCRRVWTLATDVAILRPNAWRCGTAIKLGPPTVPAVEEVLWNYDEDGWHNAQDTAEMLRVTQQIKAGQYESHSVIRARMRLYNAAPLSDLAR